MIRVDPPASPDDAGFTLLEVLVALVLLAVVMAAAGGAIGGISTAFDKGTARAESLAQVELVRDVLRRQTARFAPRLVIRPDGPRQPVSLTAQQLRFLLLDSAAPGRGGYAEAGFRIESSPAGQRLIYRQVAAGGGSPHESVLADGPFRFRFSYRLRDAAGGERWVPDVPPEGGLPVLIRLEIADARGPLPAIIVRFRADTPRGCVKTLGDGPCLDGAVASP